MYDALLPRDGGTLDLIAVYAANHGVAQWWVSGSELTPLHRQDWRRLGVKEHEPVGWIGWQVENAQNVVKLRAWYTDNTCQAYTIDYCERRLTPDDIAEIERQICAYWDIPF